MNIKNLIISSLIGGIVIAAMANIPVLQLNQLPALCRVLGGSHPGCVALQEVRGFADARSGRGGWARLVYGPV